MADELRKYLNSEESKKSIEKHIRLEKLEKERTNRYMDIAHNHMSESERGELIEKCIKKKNVENLIDYISDYAERYGEKLYTNDDYEWAFLIDGKYRVYGRFADIVIDEVPENEVIPKIFEDKYCDVYKPNGELLIHTNNMLTFTDIRVQIKQKQLNGYYIVFENKRYEIKSNGRIEHWPNGLFSVYINKLVNLIP